MQRTYAAFAGPRLVARGNLETVITALHGAPGQEQGSLQIFDETSGRIVDFDLRGPVQEAVDRALKQVSLPVRGRPRLGVESREISLLPRHWHWLDRQSRSASATIRRLIDREMKSAPDDNIDAVYCQMAALAGDLPGFEAAARALYAGQREGFLDLIRPWPGDLPHYLEDRLAAAAPLPGDDPV